MMKSLTRSLLAVGLLTATGCVSLLPEGSPPKPRYTMPAIEAAELTGETVSWSLAVEDPRATRVYDNVGIAVETAPGRIEYYANAEWADRAPRLFQTALVQSLENSERILAVGDRTATPLADYVLQTDIRELVFNVHDGGPKSVVSVYARLTDGKGEVYATRLFKQEVSTDGRSSDAVVEGFNTALDQVITDIVQWTFESGSMNADNAAA